METATHNARPWILLVEDDAEVSLLLGDGLSEGGYQVVISSTVEDAMRKIARMSFDAIVLDLRLANGSGESVIEGLRRQKGKKASVPVMVISGYLNADVVKRIRNQVQGILVKPFSITVLRARLHELLEASKERGEELGQGDHQEEEAAK